MVTAGLQEEASTRLLLRAHVLLLVLLASYGVIGPASASLFLHVYSSALLPWACWSVAGCSLVAAWGVRTLCARRSLRWVFVSVLMTSILLLMAILVAQAMAYQQAVFALYVFKEVYIVVLVEIFWLNASVVCTARMARRCYGWLCAAASAGCLMGGCLNGVLAQRLGTVSMLWLGLGLMLCALRCAKTFAPKPLQMPPPLPAWGDDVASQGRPSVSRQAARLAFLVVCFHVLMTLTDFIYIDAMARLYTRLDQRTAMMSHVQTATNAFAFTAQIGNFWVVRTLGLRGMLAGLPFILGATFGVFCMVPNAISAAMIKIISKIADYALFRSAKEMLYLPLSLHAKTTSKAFDMSAYLCAKGIASLLVLGCASAGFVNATGWLHVVFCMLLLLAAALCLPACTDARENGNMKNFEPRRRRRVHVS